MIGRSVSRYLKVSPRKMRQVIDLVRKKEVDTALATLQQLNKGASEPVQKAIRAAVDSARHHPEGKSAKLYISKITADEGPTKITRRWRAATMGRSMRIRKRQSHLLVELDVR